MQADAGYLRLGIKLVAKLLAFNTSFHLAWRQIRLWWFKTTTKQLSFNIWGLDQSHQTWPVLHASSKYNKETMSHMAILNSMTTLTMLISMVHSHQAFVCSFITCNIHQYPYLSNMHPEKINNGNVKHGFHQIGHVFEIPCHSITTRMCI